MAAAVGARETAIERGRGRAVVSVAAQCGRRYYQVAPDGRRFLFNISPAVEATPTPITVVVNWTAGLKK